MNKFWKVFGFVAVMSTITWVGHLWMQILKGVPSDVNVHQIKPDGEGMTDDEFFTFLREAKGGPVATVDE